MNKKLMITAILGLATMGNEHGNSKPSTVKFNRSPKCNRREKQKHGRGKRGKGW